MTDPTPRAPRRNTDPCAEAFRRGHRAALRGEPRDACPFVEGSGRPTWTRSYRLAWQRGWDMAKAMARVASALQAQDGPVFEVPADVELGGEEE